MRCVDSAASDQTDGQSEHVIMAEGIGEVVLLPRRAHTMTWQPRYAKIDWVAVLGSSFVAKVRYQGRRRRPPSPSRGSEAHGRHVEPEKKDGGGQALGAGHQQGKLVQVGVACSARDAQSSVHRLRAGQGGNDNQAML